MPPPTLHNTTTTAWASAASQSVTRPTRSDGTAAQVGDLVVLAIHHREGTNLATPAPAGFTFVGRADSSTTSSVMVFHKYVEASEPTSYSVSYGAVAVAMLSATLVAGVRQTNPVAGSSSNSDATSNSTVVMASVTTDSADTLILAAHTPIGGSLTGSSTFAPATGWTERYDLNSGSLTAGKRLGAMTYATQSAAGASASPSHTTSHNHASDVTFAIAIAAAAAVTTNMEATFGLSLSSVPQKRLDQARAFALSLVMPTPVSGGAYARLVDFAIGLAFQVPSASKTFMRTVQFALSLALSRTRILELVKQYSVTAALGVPRKTLNRTVSWGLALANIPRKTLNLVKPFGISVSLNAAGVLSRLIPETTRNVEVFMQVLRGRRGTIPLSYRIVRSNVLGEDLGLVPGYIAGTGTVGMSNSRDHAWELSFDMLASETTSFDPVRDYVKVYADVDLGSGLQSYPLGLYRLRKPSGTISKSHRVWQCNGYSLEDLLARHEADAGYAVGKGVDALVRAQDLIVSKAKVPTDRVLFPAVSAPLRHAIQFDSTSDSTSASWLAIVNQLLNAAGYYAVQTDAEGNFMTEKMGSRTVLEPDVSYDEGYERMVTDAVADAWDDERFANKIVVRSQDVAETPTLVAKAFNRNPDSEGSIDYLGRTIQKTINLQTAVSLAEMQVMAQAELEKASGYYRKLSITHLFDPRVWAPRRIYGLTLTDQDGEIVVDGRWNQINTSVSLSKPATPMTSELSRVEEV